jgi:hypothetical protein
MGKSPESLSLALALRYIAFLKVFWGVLTLCLWPQFGTMHDNVNGVCDLSIRLFRTVSPSRACTGKTGRNHAIEKWVFRARNLFHLFIDSDSMGP